MVTSEANHHGDLSMNWMSRIRPNPQPSPKGNSPTKLDEPEPAKSITHELSSVWAVGEGGVEQMAKARLSHQFYPCLPPGESLTCLALMR